MTPLFVWDAVVAWRDRILKEDVFRRNKKDKLSHLSRLIAKGLLDIGQPLSKFIETSLEDKLRMINATNDWSPSIKQARSTILRSFYKFAKETKIKPAHVIIFNKPKDIQQAVIGEFLSSSEDKAKSQFITENQLASFFNKMILLNPRDGLATWLMWDIKASINQILNIKVGDIDLDNGIIKLGDELRKVDLHDEMKRCIRAEKKDKADTDFLFATETGKRIHPGQLVRNMKAASKLAKLPIIISPKILAAHSKAYAKKISEEKCNRLEAKFFEQCYLYLKNCKWSCEIKQKDL